MEFVDGRSRPICGRPLTFEALVKLSARASGLQAAHERGIVHRDVFSDNIIFHWAT